MPVNGTFTAQDASVYELLHDLLSGRQNPEEVEPLQVVVDRGLHIVRGHRRGLALCALQGIWRDRTVLAPCRLYKAEDPEVASQFANKDTKVDGLAMHLHGKCPEAWHMGKPLFRTPQEWCDSTAEQEACRMCPDSDMNQDMKRAGFLGSPASEHLNLEHDLKTAAKSIQKPEKGEPLSCKGACPARSSTTRLSTALKQDLPVTAKASRSSGKNKEARHASAGHSELKEGMVVCVQSKDSKTMFGDILQVSRSKGAKVRFSVGDQAGRFQVDWFPLNRLKVPDSFNMKQSMQESVQRANPNVSGASDKKDAAPIEVCRNGSALHGEKTVSEKLHREPLMLHDPKLPMGQHSIDLQTQCVRVAKGVGGCKAEQEALTANSTLLPRKGNEANNITLVRPELKESTVVCVQHKGSRMMLGEVLEVSHFGVAVFYSRDQGDQGQSCQVDWFPLDNLKVPDFSKIKPGMQECLLKILLVGSLSLAQSWKCRI